MSTINLEITTKNLHGVNLQELNIIIKRKVTIHLTDRTTYVLQDAVRDMAPGSVIVDLAAEMGGNVQTTKKGVITKIHGVTHIGLTDMPSRMPAHASTLYANNISGFLFSLGEFCCRKNYI